jgi:putative transposase
MAVTVINPESIEVQQMSKKKDSRADQARDIALYRYSLIRPLTDEGLSAAKRGKLVRELAAQVHIGPTSEPVTVSRASLNRWIYRYRTGGFDGLIPTRRYLGPRTDPQVLDLAAQLKREHPARTAAHIARMIEAEKGSAPCARTLQRHFARLELNTGPDGQPPKVFGRFQAEEPDELWVSDGLHGGVVEGNRAVLFAILDDYSRYVPAGRWGHGEDTLGMQNTLHDAVKTHGCPRKFYCDNGSAYSSHQLAWSAAALGITLVHSRPGKPQGRGKIERFNRTVRDQFLVEIEAAGGVASLDELNQLFTAWLHQKYHRSTHSETGTTPAARYHAADRTPPPRPDPALLRRAFLWREQRRVTVCATVSLHGNHYEVDTALVGRMVDLLFCPFDLTVIDVEYQGKPMGHAVPRVIGRHVHPKVKTQAAAPVETTGINYLQLLTDAHQRDVGQAINFAALREPNNTETSVNNPQPTRND